MREGCVTESSAASPTEEHLPRIRLALSRNGDRLTISHLMDFGATLAKRWVVPIVEAGIAIHAMHQCRYLSIE
jgi:hypothetical protein